MEDIKDYPIKFLKFRNDDDIIVSIERSEYVYDKYAYYNVGYRKHDETCIHFSRWAKNGRFRESDNLDDVILNQDKWNKRLADLAMEKLLE